MSQLPDKPSDLIELALSDLEKCERSRKYQIDMTTFYVDIPNEPCRVCFAGSVIARRLDKRGAIIAPPDFDLDTQNKLWFLSDIAVGEILRSALGGLKLVCPKKVAKLQRKKSYHDDPKQFKAEMRSIASKLREVGL